MNQNIVICIIGLYLIYKILSGKEGFALSTGITTDNSSLDLTKYYQVGTRAVSNTVTPSKNGGAECTEYPDTAFKLAASVNAVCKGEVQDSYYSFSNDTKLGTTMFPFNVQSATVANQFWHPRGGNDSPADNTQIVWYGGGDNPRNRFTMSDDGTIRHAVSTDLCVGRGEYDILTLGKAYCDGNHKFNILSRGVLQHKMSGLCMYPENNFVNGSYPKLGGCGDTTPGNKFTAVGPLRPGIQPSSVSSALSKYNMRAGDAWSRGVGYFDVANEEECAAKCEMTPECAGFVSSIDGKKCWLKAYPVADFQPNITTVKTYIKK